MGLPEAAREPLERRWVDEEREREPWIPILDVRSSVPSREERLVIRSEACEAWTGRVKGWPMGAGATSSGCCVAAGEAGIAHGAGGGSDDGECAIQYTTKPNRPSMVQS